MELDLIEGMDFGQLQLRFKKEDGTFHRDTLAPGDFDKAEEYGGDVLEAANEVWTDQVVSIWNNK